ncbi:hypothetical protein E2C01_041186 [Portunus trituberculatus]|uniref:Secreted protein n=1 Tax=Portunus trituberculatus TaxID=210409 RepID=A0A5B7FJD0_PORTR|nr:hypothetical protein [Portunus trituberculatus]
MVVVAVVVVVAVLSDDARHVSPEGVSHDLHPRRLHPTRLVQPVQQLCGELADLPPHTTGLPHIPPPPPTIPASLTRLAVHRPAAVAVTREAMDEHHGGVVAIEVTQTVQVALDQVQALAVARVTPAGERNMTLVVAPPQKIF